MQDIRLPLQILAEAAQLLGCESTNSDDISKAVLRVSNGRKHFFAGLGKIGMYPLNPHFAAALASDKAWAYQVLSQAGFKIPKGDYFFLTNDWLEYRPANKDMDAARRFAASVGYPLFVKPNDSSSGMLAELLFDDEKLKQHLLQIAQISKVAVLQEYINLPEYRIFVVDDHVEFVYQRTKPTVTGDGKRTIRELITAHNSLIPIKSHQVQFESPSICAELTNRKLTLDTVLPVGDKIEVAAHANLASGGSIVGLTYQLPEWIHVWSSRVAKSLGLRVAGIDVFSSQPIDENCTEDNLTIIEVNSSPNLGGIYKYGEVERALGIWKKILLKFFNNN